MKQGGRPRRSEEQPNSPFGETLKEHLRRIKDLTQAQLARESMIAEKTLSNMVKGKRKSGHALRRDLRAIMKVLYQKGALRSLAEANHLITRIPTVKELDERDPDDAEVIKLVRQAEDAKIRSDRGDASLPEMTPSAQRNTSSSDQVPPEIFTAPTEEQGETTSRRQQRWFIGSVWLLLAIIFFGILFKNILFPWQTPPPDTCPDTKDGVILYTDPNFQGHCHLFPPGDYDLAQFGLDQNVSSLKDPDAAYYVRLIDRTNRPGSFDKDVPQLPADWNDQAHSLHVEKHRQTFYHTRLTFHHFP
jgi:transcriptional regulator with XRE-family HTH domain